MIRIKFRIKTVSIMVMLITAFLTVITASADDPVTLVYTSPSSQVVSPGQSFSVSIYCSPSQAIKSYEFKISFDPSLLQANSVTEGTIFSGYTTFFNSGTINNVAGTIINIYGLILGSGNVTASGSLAVVSFTSKTISGTSSISIYDVGITNEIAYVSISVTNGSVQVDATAPEIVNRSPSTGYTGNTYTFNISATDNVDSASSLTVNVNYTHGSTSGNVTMTNTGGNYFAKSITLDLYSTSSLTYKFYAQDSHGNLNSTSTLSATVYDNDAPTISGVTSVPTSQEVGCYVNITGSVTDNIAVNKVYLNIAYPNSSSENISITDYKIGNTYYNNRTYSSAGTYSYFLWANDSRNNARTSSTNTFTIGDSTPPTISNVAKTNSSILDTDPAYGWFNITATVSDAVGVDQVLLNLTYPNSTVGHLTMSSAGSNNYYYNTSLASYGNYSYLVWADDASSNQVVSSSYSISMPPNWDVNSDGSQTILDLVLVSNHYSQTGSTGWIREDVDNNGAIQVFDLVLVANHYGETWWV